MEKLTTKQLTNIVNTQHGQIQSLIGLINAYIEFKGDRKEFGSLLKEKYGKPAETAKND